MSGVDKPMPGRYDNPTTNMPARAWTTPDDATCDRCGRARPRSELDTAPGCSEPGCCIVLVCADGCALVDR